MSTNSTLQIFSHQSAFSTSLPLQNALVPGSLAQSNASMEDSRLYIGSDGTLRLAEKPLGYVVGEQLLNVTRLIKSTVSRLFKILDFQILPGASGERVELVEDSVKSVNKDSGHTSEKSITALRERFQRGFLPMSDPVHSFSTQSNLNKLEQVAHNLTNLVRRGDVKVKVEEGGFLPNELSNLTENERLRAHAMITSVAHAYILEESNRGASSDPVAMLPDILGSFINSAKASSRALSQTYETYILQNWERIDSSKEISYENIKPLVSYTGLESEAWFIKVHVMSEYIAAKAITSSIEIREKLAGQGSEGGSLAKDIEDNIIQNMKKVEEALLDLAANIAKMEENCKPVEFYFLLRPYLKNHPKGFLIGREYFQDIFPNTMIRSGSIAYAPRGASGAESSIIPAIDACFGFNVTQQETMADMLNYMPPEHVELIDWLKGANIRSFIGNEARDLAEAYNGVVRAAAEVRKVHFKEIIEKFILAFIPIKVLEKEGALGTAGTDFRAFLSKNIIDTEKSMVELPSHDEL